MILESYGIDGGFGRYNDQHRRTCRRKFNQGNYELIADETTCGLLGKLNSYFLYLEEIGFET